MNNTSDIWRPAHWSHVEQLNIARHTVKDTRHSCLTIAGTWQTLTPPVAGQSPLPPRRAPTMAVSAPIYLTDFTCFDPPEDLRAPFFKVLDEAWKWKCCTPESHGFVHKIFSKSGMGPEGGYLPACIQPKFTDKPKTDLASASVEARMVFHQVVEAVLERTGVKPEQVDILITNCSVYCPTPSLASLVINMFKMREDIESYHLGGMGCAMGVVGLSLVRDLLKAHPNKICLFVSSEIVTHAFYPGTVKEMLVTNALFRMGGSAAILTSNPAWRRRSKYQLTHFVRVHTGASDSAHSTLDWRPDEEGINGIVINKHLPAEAAKAMEKALRRITPSIMTWSQYVEAAGNYMARYINYATGYPMPASYRPDFTRCADHFLLHAGGYAILRGVQKGMQLPADKMLPSFVSLRDYGNTSSSSTWYTWTYQESTGGVKRGERVLQVGVGGGMKCGVALWVALRDIKDEHRCWDHLGGRVQTEADLPRPISVDYKSIYSMGGAQQEGKEEQQVAKGKMDAAATIAAQAASARQELAAH